MLMSSLKNRTILPRFWLVVDRSHIHRERGFRSRLESKVEQALVELGLSPQYETDHFVYYLKKRYKPDFKIGDVYIEVKGYWPPPERTKFLAVVLNNPELRIFVALQHPGNRITKNSRTTYAEWCEKHGIAWCPIPIPQDFLQSWLNGQRRTFRAPPRTATAATPQRSIQMDLISASHAIESSPSMDTHGNVDQ